MSLSGRPIVGTSTKESEESCTWLYLPRCSCRTALRYSCHCFVSSVSCTSATPCLRPATACCSSCSQGICWLSATCRSETRNSKRFQICCAEFSKNWCCSWEVCNCSSYAVHAAISESTACILPHCTINSLASNLSRYFAPVSRTVASCSKSGKGLCAGSSLGSPDRLISQTACKLLSLSCWRICSSFCCKCLRCFCTSSNWSAACTSCACSMLPTHRPISRPIGRRCGCASL